MDIKKSKTIQFSHTINKRLFILIAASITLTFTLGSCNKGKKIPDVSHIEANLEIIRFEKEMYGIDSSNITYKANELASQHPEFVEIYTSPRVMREKGWTDSTDVAVLEHLMKGRPMQMLYDTCMVIFDDFSSYEKELEQAFQFYQYYFPDAPLPKVYTCITEFVYQGFTYGPEVLVIGTEHYMGKDFPAYEAIFPRYQSQFFTPDHLVSASMELMVGEQITDHPENNMLDAMIREGKKLYILDHLLPYEEDSIKLKFTSAQTEWCNENEHEIWKFFVTQDLIYSTDKRKYMKYTNPAPTSPGMPTESPGRTANWTGWQIVKQYMRFNPDKRIQDLINEKDAQKILKGARYKPKR